MLGSMILVAMAVLAGAPRADMPLWLRVSIQSIIGGAIGRRIDRAAMRTAGTLLPSIAITSAWYVAGTALIGWLVARMAGIELDTAFLGTAPGGVAEMTALAIAAGADAAFVATMQTLRVIASNVLVPLLARTGGRRDAREDQSGIAPAVARAGKASAAEAAASEGGHWIFGLVASLGGGIAFTLGSVPAGGVLGSMVTIAAFRLAGLGFQRPPRPVLTAAYIGLGISVGVSFDAGTLSLLGSSAGVMILATVLTMGSGFLLAAVLRRSMRLDYRTAMLACSPGGLSLMAVVAEETGAQSVLVSLFHLVRIVWVILAMPVFIRLAG